MAQTVPTREPGRFTAGDSVTWQKTLADYPASAGWVLKYRLINAGGFIDIVSAAAGDDHLVDLAAAATALYAAGSYTWSAYVENAGQRHTVGSGTVVVDPDLAAQTAGFDTRSTAARTLAAVDAWLTSKDLSIAEFQHNGRTLKNIPIAELLKLRSRLQAEVRGEEAASRLAAGLPSRSKVLVRF